MRAAPLQQGHVCGVLPDLNVHFVSDLIATTCHAETFSGANMQPIATTLTIVAVIAVSVVLIGGLWNMTRNGSANLSQKLMRWRVILQLVAIIIGMLVLYLAKSP